jgi:predicted nuclease of restriction endonuclease-like RecB superfamily
MGLLCQVSQATDAESYELVVSGPYALFRHTRSYGAALHSLVGRLLRCDDYRLEAECVLGAEREVGRLVLRAGDPLSPARELRAYDSRTEERFAKDFRRLALDWDLHREPQPIALGTELCFPDFLLQRRNTAQTYWLEIIGFWTPAYLHKKLSQLRHAQLERLILCVDESRRCAEGAFDGLGHIVWYRKRIDARAVLAIIAPQDA